ncbi:alanine--tRNA ligase [Winogradskyella aurantiaca]|uniref:alanine--tRNA ligase n=1 Tax=Winogradskyella aurantiaca TaxID=2219558 RepID=UPI000E1CD0EF|nr:alanine--tRNA ligase [Winogradskyella aurantiaca]
MKSRDIRSKFLEFFKSKDHLVVPSAPMVVKNDPTLMFVNSGMAPFKEYFLGNAEPKKPRITDSQKCLRVSGKHNDLEEVGYDTYHHTLFEMLGNWSFGDYFKEEAIAWAWELLTEIYKIDKDKLYVTIFEGDKEDGLSLDQEAFNIWKKYISEDRILKGNKKDNFWEMGEQGPCGPCSEIHVDIRTDEERAQVDGKDLVNMDHPQVVEIWNLVFMEYNRKANGSLESLPYKHIDTGMGFERLCMVLQGVQSNYDTDVFTPLIREIETITDSTYGKDDKVDVAIRVIADHIRAVAFSIADGQLPGNSGAGYVIRRILRRAIRYGFTFLNEKEPFIYKLSRTLSDQLYEAFPELKAQERIIHNVIKEEEQSFLKTLDQGLMMMDRVLDKTTEGELVSGKRAFELYDTYGFPLDLTQLIAKEKGYEVDTEGFESEMQKQKDRSRAAAASETSDWVILEDDDIEEFIGYDVLTADVRITRYRKVIQQKEERYHLVFNLTPFYPEGGGQVGDGGALEAPNGDVIYIWTTKKENNVIIHETKALPKDLTQTFKAIVGEESRHLSACNHTATHLLHQALRTILGTHVEQKGSLVQPKSLRFDFSHFKKVSPEELQEIEDFVNARIRDRLPLEEQRQIPLQTALDQGALALFGEKYGDVVRAIRFGKSMELCGGTHVSNTRDIWYFKIKSESAIAAGIRRIEAITNRAVGRYFEEVEQNYIAVKEVLKSNNEPAKAISQLQNENAQLKKELEGLKRDKVKSLKTDLLAKTQDINGVNFLATRLDLDAAASKNLAFDMGALKDNLFLLFGSDHGGKAILTCYISKELATDRELNAGQIVRELGKHIQGGGGGQPFFATAGGKNPAGLDEALKAVRSFIE